MKKLLLPLGFMLAVAVGFANVQQVVIVPLEVSIIDPTIPTNPKPKVPIQVPIVIIDGQTLSYNSSCLGATVQILRNGVTVFTDVVTTTLQTILPTYLSGEYELQLFPEDCSYYFFGYITL